jgi:hypothetical protein
MRHWAGALLIFGALGLVFLGGCFLIGVQMVVFPQAFNTNAAPPPNWPAAAYMFVIVCYVVAFACFGGAVLLFVLATRGLLKAMGQ